MTLTSTANDRSPALTRLLALLPSLYSCPF